MRPRTTLILVVIAVIVLGAGWYFGPHQTPAAAERAETGALFFPKLESTIAQAARIEITHAGHRFAIVRKGDVWTLPSLGFYPVEATKVHALLAGLAELRTAGRRTADPAEFAALGLADPEQPGTSGVLVTVSDGAGHALARLILGHQQYAMAGGVVSGGAETLYVRRPGEKRSWLAAGALSVDAEPDLWIDHAITNIDHGKVSGITVRRGAETLALAPQGGKLTLVRPARHAPLDPDRLDDVWRALESLSFSSVRAGPALPGAVFAHSAFTLAGGTVVRVTLAKEGKDLWARFAAAGTDAEAKSLARTFGDWSFRLGAWHESTLAPRLAGLLARKPTPAATQ